jgi:ComF family protein
MREADIEVFLRKRCLKTMQYRNASDHCQPKMLRQVYEPLIGLILPELCQRCGDNASGGFCAACRREFRYNVAACSICGLGPLPGGVEHCRDHAAHWQLARIVAPLIYAPPAQTWLHALKYDGDRALGRAFGQLLADAAAIRRNEIDAIVSVPLHPRRLMQRGYNQALEIARSTAATLRLPILRAGITRTRETTPQASLDCAQRWRNLAGAFSVRRELAGRRLAIVDDVMTTGATMNALAGALLAAGAQHVEGWAVARTPRGSATSRSAYEKCNRATD